MLTSPGRRFLIVGFLVLVMFVPLFFAAEVVNERKSYSRSTIDTVGLEWGGPQTLTGPQLVIPVTRQVTRMASRPRLDPATGVVMVNEAGEELTERFEETVRVRAEPVFIYPGVFDARLETQTQIRSRGIFRVPVYAAQVEVAFDFDTSLADRVIAANETAQWDRAEIHFGVTRNKALRGQAVIEADGRALELQPLTQGAGFAGRVGDPRAVAGYALRLGLNGAEELMLAPVGRDSRVTMVSDWPHPSFSGAFLPDGSEIAEDGFTATWTIPHLARALPQVTRDDPQGQARQRNAFGVRLIEPNDFYQKAFRASRYGILFVALTFLTVVLIERSTKRPVHPVQYILIGLVQTVFVLLMVAYAEHLGFALAYLISSGAVISLLTAFGLFGLKLGVRAWVLGAMLVVVYAVLYLILHSTDYALLAGSTLAFLALGLTMWATRNEDWFDKGGLEPPAKGPGLFGRMFGAQDAGNRKAPWGEASGPDKDTAPSQ